MNFKIKMTVFKKNLVFLETWRQVCLKVICNFINRKGTSRRSALVFALWSHIWRKQKMVLCGRKLIPYIFTLINTLGKKPQQNSQCNLIYYILSFFYPMLFTLKAIYFYLFEIDLPWMNHYLNRPGLPNWLACGQIYGHSFLRVWCYHN